MIQRIAVVTAFFVFSALGQNKFLNPADQDRYLSPTENMPHSSACPEGGTIPILTVLSKDGRKVENAHLWGGARQAWLFTSGGRQLVSQAIKYVLTARFLFPGNSKKQSVVFRIPCEN